jgi:hypothetical protein
LFPVHHPSEAGQKEHTLYFIPKHLITTANGAKRGRITLSYSSKAASSQKKEHRGTIDFRSEEENTAFRRREGITRYAK